MVVRVSKWLLYDKQVPTGKTNAYRVSSRQGRVLGEVKWCGRWRQYAFFPNPETVFNAVCLEDIRSFCESLMDERKK